MFSSKNHSLYWHWHRDREFVSGRRVLKLVLGEHVIQPRHQCNAHVLISCTEHVMLGFCHYKLFTLDPALLHIQHKQKNGAECSTEELDVSIV